MRGYFAQRMEQASWRERNVDNDPIHITSWLDHGSSRLGPSWKSSLIRDEKGIARAGLRRALAGRSLGRYICKSWFFRVLLCVISPMKCRVQLIQDANLLQSSSCKPSAPWFFCFSTWQALEQWITTSFRSLVFMMTAVSAALFSPFSSMDLDVRADCHTSTFPRPS